MELHRRHQHGATMLQAEQNMCMKTALEHTWTKAHELRLLASFDTTSCKCISNDKFRVKGYPKNTQILYILKFSPTKSEITITGSNDPRQANQREFCLLKVQPLVPFETPGVDCYKILIQLFQHLRTRKRPRNNCIDRCIIRIAHNSHQDNIGWRW